LFSSGRFIFLLLALQAPSAETWNPVVKGIVATAITVVVLMILIKGFFEGFLEILPWRI
jgi:hypothetical protein